MNKVIEYIISAKDRTQSAISSALSRVKNFASSVGSNLMNIKAGFDMVSGVVSKAANVIATAVKEAFKFEKANADFKVLLKSADAAREHIAELRKFASSTPLTFDDLSKASKLLLSFGADVSAIMPSLKMLGDISMGDSQKFQGLALVFAQVQSAGKLMGQDLLQMINQGFNPLTIIAKETGKSVAELKDKMADGAISFEMVQEAMRLATSEGGLFCGAMEEAAKTGEGLLSTLSDKWTDSVRTFGEAFQDTAKDGIQGMIDKLDELQKNGSIEVWTSNALEGIQSFAEGAMKVLSPVFKVFSMYFSALKGGYTSIGNAVGGFAGALAGGGSLGDAFSEGWGGFKQGWVDAFDLDGAEAERENRIRARAKARQSKAAATAQATPAAATAQTETKSLSAMLEEAEAKKAAEAEAKEYEKYQKELERAEREDYERRLAYEERLAAERAALMAKEWQANLEEAENYYSTCETEAQAAAAALDAARSKEATAWGWYRNRDSWKAQLNEERENAKAEEQFERDFARLKHRSNWRTATLSDEDELIRRVGLAKEETKAAEKFAEETARATREAADSLASIKEQISEAGE